MNHSQAILINSKIGKYRKVTVLRALIYKFISKFTQSAQFFKTLFYYKINKVVKYIGIKNAFWSLSQYSRKKVPLFFFFKTRRNRKKYAYYLSAAKSINHRVALHQMFLSTAIETAVRVRYAHFLSLFQTRIRLLRDRRRRWNGS